MESKLRTLAQQPWGLWLRQVRSIVELESRRNLFTWRSLWLYFIAFAPTVIIVAHALFDRSHHEPIAGDTTVLAAIFQFYYVRLGIYFGCLGIFTRLIRGEMIERSLHYYLLAPVRREVLLIGKFLAGAVRSILLFETAVVASFFFMYFHYGQAGMQYVLDGPGLSQLLAYMLITALACLGYGAIFLLFSMLMKNPAPAALLLMGWEFISAALPALLQRFSISSYLRHLMPVSVPAEGVFAILTVATEPIPAWLAVTGALTLTLVILALSSYRMRFLEISYTTE
ncbi:MAG TPA: ABC transporter permease subunit [Terriglobales bacterium]|nr:ABC transporter permease subunit [Terriglobales bacterium]